MSSFPSSTWSTADSLVGSLCREMGALRERARQLMADLSRCRDGGLVDRLRAELATLERRRRELSLSVRTLERSQLRDGLALAFLLELTRRPLVVSQGF
jgi:hypothetical protein